MSEPQVAAESTPVELKTPKTFATRVQRAIISALDFWYRLRANRLERVSWVIGPNEVANMMSMFSGVVPGSVTVIVARHPFYASSFDFEPPKLSGRISRLWWRWFALPAIFVKLAYSAQGFIYVSQNGYLQNFQDHREFELSFLQRHGVKIVFVFTGSDIRSPLLMREHERLTGLPNISSYLAYTDPVFRSPGFDEERRRIGALADCFADAVFTYRVDQMGYIEGPSEPFPYLIPDEQIRGDLTRFENVSVPVVLHAPSSPIIKGSQLVRAAVAELREEGFDFEYVELTGVPHEQVLVQLGRAHVVLNEFYAHVPGVFAVEAMAAGCVVLTSADEMIETDLPAGSNEAWIVTKHWQVYTQLKEVLSHPERMKAQALRGQQWVREEAAMSVVAPRLRGLLEELVRD